MFFVNDLPASEKPRERLLSLGSHALSDSELLSIILRSGGEDESVLDLSRRMLTEFEGFGGLSQASIEQLMSFRNVGVAKASSVQALFEISVRLRFPSDEKVKMVRNPKDVFGIVKRDLFGKKKESLLLISLDSRNKFIAKDVLSVGTVNESMMHPREVFRQALLRNAVSIALAHNHPSQDPTPSSEDILLTEKIAKAGSLLGIPLIDHVVVCDGKHCSMKAMGVFSTKKFD